MIPMRVRDRATVGGAQAGVEHLNALESDLISRMGLEHARRALANSRPVAVTGARGEAEIAVVNRLRRHVENQIQIRSGAVARPEGGLSPVPTTTRDGSGPCKGCAKVRAVVRSWSDAIAAALNPVPGPLQRQIDQFHHQQEHKS